jgi:hypothetical protein
MKFCAGWILRFAQDFACGLRRPQIGSSSVGAWILRFAQDFACGLRRPQIGSSSNLPVPTIHLKASFVQNRTLYRSIL